MVRELLSILLLQSEHHLHLLVALQSVQVHRILLASHTELLQLVPELVHVDPGGGGPLPLAHMLHRLAVGTAGRQRVESLVVALSAHLSGLRN